MVSQADKLPCQIHHTAKAGTYGTDMSPPNTTHNPSLTLTLASLWAKGGRRRFNPFCLFIFEYIFFKKIKQGNIIKVNSNSNS